MEIVSALLEIGKSLWGSASRPLGYICNLNDNVCSLNKANEDLKAVSEDVKTRVEREEEETRAQRTRNVANWLGEVQEFVGAVDQVLREAEERGRIKHLGRCLPPNCWSRYKMGKRVYQMLNEASELRLKEGKFDVVTSSLPPPPVLEMPMDETVGMDISFDKVWRWLVDEKQGVIGLFGIGGVGKTTLMKRIHEKLSRENHGFDVVIWVVVPRQLDEDIIQDTIRKRLNIKNESWEGRSWDDRVDHLLNVLKRKKFVLLIDDVWAGLDLNKIGVPRHSLKNGSKVVFTTRSEQVCDHMEANRTFKVECLTPNKALELFMKSVGKSILHDHLEILELAKEIAHECKGLPLALITVGRVMAGRSNPDEWEHALTTLRNNPYKLSGKVEEMYHILAFSYYNLNDSAQRCFIYCCLFPKNYLIRRKDLIELWMGEGLLRDMNDPYSMRLEGAFVLEDLKKACLLESELDDEGQQRVKMHDVIRDMGTWIARDRGQKENKWLVIEREEDLPTKKISKGGDAERVSLWGKQIQNINKLPPRYSQLKTLMVRETRVRHMPRGFFNSMDACLTVLDLSDNEDIRSFPEDICQLINLEYLNLSGTSIKELPRDINKLIRLRWLLLESMKRGILIPIEVIASLPLTVLSMWRSRPRKKEEMIEKPKKEEMKEEMTEKQKKEEMIETLGRMEHLVDLSIRVHESSSVHEIFQSPNLQGSIRRTEFTSCLDLTRIVVSHSLSHLELLILEKCHKLVQMEMNEVIRQAPNCPCFPSLTEVSITGCGLSDLSWLVHAPKLRELTVQRCQSMEKIIGDAFVPGQSAALRPFSRLNNLRLQDLPKLTSICDQALSFPLGVKFQITNCPVLRKLPLDWSSGRGGSFSVKADVYWWAKFEWEDPAARVTFQSRRRSSGVEEMKYGEARQRIEEDRTLGWAEIGFLPHGPSELGPHEKLAYASPPIMPLEPIGRE